MQPNHRIKKLVLPTYVSLGNRLAKDIAHAIKSFTPTTQKPYFVLGLITGGTPISAYDALIKMNLNGEVDFSNVVTFNPDEFAGLPKDHPQSFARFMEENLFQHLNPRPAVSYFLNGGTRDPEKECREFEDRINSYGGIDLQILGIGENGHIAYMEPESSFTSRTQRTPLTEKTRQGNAKLFSTPEENPTHALSMGLETILKSKRIILVANGEKKAEAIDRALNQPPNESCPASILQQHPNVSFYLDREAAQRLSKRGMT